MTDGESLHQINNGERLMTNVAVVDLGPGNVGSFGPVADTPEAECARIAETSCDDKYNRPATNRYICVDGRLSDEELDMLHSGVSPEVADPQLAGGIVISETAADLQGDPSTHRPQSFLVAKNTRDAIADGIVVTVHGDKHKGKAGCRAHVDMRAALHFNAENADIITPTAWSISKALGLDKHIEEDDITESIVNGKQAADNPAIWDVTVEESTDIMIANGAEYFELNFDHNEKAERVDLTDGAFAKVDFVRDNSNTEELEVQAFSASLGKYAKDAFERGAIHGIPERETALKIMRVVLFNLGKSKMLINEKTKVGLVTPA